MRSSRRARGRTALSRQGKECPPGTRRGAVRRLMSKCGLALAGQVALRWSSQAASRVLTGAASGISRPSRCSASVCRPGRGRRRRLRRARRRGSASPARLGSVRCPETGAGTAWAAGGVNGCGQRPGQNGAAGQTRGLTCSSARGQGRGRTADLPLFRRTLVPTELPARAVETIPQGPEADEFEVVAGREVIWGASGGCPMMCRLPQGGRPPSSSGLGRRPFTAVARVRIPLGVRTASDDLPIGFRRRQ